MIDVILSSVFVTVAVGVILVTISTEDDEIGAELVGGTGMIDVWIVDGGSETDDGVEMTVEEVGTSTELGGVDVGTSELVELTDSVLEIGVGSEEIDEGVGVGGTLSDEVRDVGGTLLVTLIELVELLSVGGDDELEGIEVAEEVIGSELVMSVGVEIVSEGVDTEVDSVPVTLIELDESETVGIDEVTSPVDVSEGVGTDEVTSPDSLEVADEVTSPDSLEVADEVTSPDSLGVADEVTDSLGVDSEGVGTELDSLIEVSEGVG